MMLWLKNFYNTYLRRWVKAIASAVGGALAGLLINFIRGDVIIPQSKEDWVTLLVATLGPPLLALFSPANKITQKQLDKDPNVIGGTVIDEAPPREVAAAIRSEQARTDPGQKPARKSSWK